LDLTLELTPDLKLYLTPKLTPDLIFLPSEPQWLLSLNQGFHV